jgi:sporulation protein YlmC with PRC-barrel domain
MRHLLYIICAIVLGGCNNGRNVPALNDVVFDSIPSNAYFVAENEEWKIFLNDEATGDSIEGVGAVKQVSLWTYNKSKKSVKMLMMSHPHANGSWFTMEHAVKIPLDSIPTISKVTVLSWKGESLKLLVEGCSDYRNVQSFIIDAESDQAICLPTNRGLIGVSEEDGLLIMQSYAYYEDGGRYNKIQAFNLIGKRIASMEARVKDN